MDAPVSCPVCTLYLREGVSLQNHLNTHPKDQVIEALLKYCGSVRDVNAPGEIEGVVDGQYENQQNDQTVAENASSSISCQQPYPCGSSHFTAAVTYQQFMSSNASVGGTVLPQCFSVPAIITTPAGEPGQATIMPLLYNPYVIQQQQQQLQFYNAFRTIPQQPLSRQIVSPSPLFPVSPQFAVTASGNPIYQSSISSSSALQNGENIPSNPDIYVPSVATQDDDLKCNDQEVTCPEDSPKCKADHTKPKISNIQCIDNEDGTDSRESEPKVGNECDNSVISVVFEDDVNNVREVPVAKGDKSSPGTSIEYDGVVCEIKIDSDEKVPDGEESCSGDNDANGHLGDSLSSPVSPSVHIKVDLNRTNPSPSERFLDGNSNSRDLTSIEGESPEDNGATSLSENKTDNVGWGFLSEKDKVNSEPHSDENVKEYSEYIISDLYSSNTEPKNSDQATSLSCGTQDGDTSARHFKVVDIEGMQVLVASHLLAPSGEQNADVEHPSRTPSEHSCCGAPQDSEETSTNVNPDIQTDEVMPAMGELSGQESIGENDTNSWSQEKDDITTSYDLLAREKWEVSDGSDEENEADVGDIGDVGVDTEDNPCDVSPSETLPLPTASSVEDQFREEKTKKKEKPKCFYKCWTCNQIFTCPKERRVHQSEKHGARGLERLDTKVGGLKNSSWPIVKIEDTLTLDSTMKQEEKEDKVCLKSEEDILSNIPEEIDETKTVGETKNSSFDECVKEIKKEEEQSKPDDNAFKFICSRCEGVFASAKSLHQHVRTAHGQSQFTCRTCSEKYPSEAAYLAHLKVHPLECSRCGKYFYRHQNLNLHIRRHLGIKPFKCTICDKAFVTKQKLAEHTNTHTGDTPIKCNLCTETFRRYSNLIQHKNRHHLKIKKKIKDFICHCGEVFHSQKKLHWHKEIHDEKPKTCNYCSERFVHASSLTRHIRKAHDQRYFPCQGRERENVECPICGCIFLKSSLPVHMRLHSGERPFNCHICGKNFSTKWNLQLHRWTHASRSLKPYKCSLCKSAFIRHSEYTSHMHSHRNVRPYTCNYCGSQFIRKYNCIRHAREHESEKPFVCNICQKSFHRRYYLKEHMRIHSGLRPFTCHICGKTSSTKSNHNKHVKIHHAREAVNTEG